MRLRAAVLVHVAHGGLGEAPHLELLGKAVLRIAEVAVHVQQQTWLNCNRKSNWAKFGNHLFLTESAGICHNLAWTVSRAELLYTI